MGEILTTMMRPNDVTASAGHAAERIAGPRRVRADVLFDQRPGGFDGIEIVRVGRQKLHRRPAAFDDRADRWRALWAFRLSSTTTSPHRRCGARLRRTH